jgi:3-dehydrosphinganine reductase
MRIRDTKGVTAFITGGSSGIGLAMANLLASQAANVMIFSRQAETLVTALKEIERHRVSENQRLSFMPLDVSCRNAAEQVMQKAVENFGPPHILINSAGISHPQKFEDTQYDTFDQIIKINLYGTWNTVDLLLPHLKASRGYIVNVASIAGFIGVFGMTAYSASKYAVIGFSETLRSELKPLGVTVSVLCPPDVSTPMLDKANTTKPLEAKALSANAATMTADEVAKALLRSMGRGEFMIIPNSAGKFTYVMKRLFPGLAERIVDQTIRKVQKGQS